MRAFVLGVVCLSLSAFAGGRGGGAAPPGASFRNPPGGTHLRGGTRFGAHAYFGAGRSHHSKSGGWSARPYRHPAYLGVPYYSYSYGYSPQADTTYEADLAQANEELNQEEAAMAQVPGGDAEPESELLTEPEPAPLSQQAGPAAATKPIQPKFEEAVPQEDIYHWTGDDGVETYSNVPPPEVREKAKKVEAQLGAIKWTPEKR